MTELNQTRLKADQVEDQAVDRKRPAVIDLVNQMFMN
jgi:hypothetical protein